MNAPEGAVQGWTAVPTWIIREADLTLGELSVLLVLLSRANSSGQCWPSRSTIAKEAKQGLASVKRNLASLREKGFVSWETRVSEAGAPTSSLYRTHVENPLKGWAHSEPRGAHSEPGVGSQVTGGGLTVSPELDTRTRSTQPAGGHEHEPNTRRALAALAAKRMDENELLRICYEAGDGDPWHGYLLVKHELSTIGPEARDRAAVLRKRLGVGRPS